MCARDPKSLGPRMGLPKPVCARDPPNPMCARDPKSLIIPGRVHVAPLQLGRQFLTVSLTVLEGGQDEGFDFLFGLDNLLRHQCCLDLKVRTEIPVQYTS